MSKYKLSEESARDTLGRFNEWYDIDPEELEELAKVDEKTAIAQAILDRRLIRTIREGLVDIREEQGKNGAPTLIVEQRLKYPVGDVSLVQYKEITGLLMSAVAYEKKDNDDMKMFKKLGVISGEGYSLFQNMVRGDRKVIQTLSFLFSQAE